LDDGIDETAARPTSTMVQSKPIAASVAIGRMSEVTAAIVREGKVIEHVAFDANVPACGKTKFIWIEVLDPVDRDFAILQERFRLHSVAVEDAMRPAQIPKVDLYDEQIFVVLKLARLENDAIKYGEIDAFVGRHYIITVRRTSGCAQTHAHEEFLTGPKPAEARPDFILHAILDFVVNGYFPVVQMIEDEVFAMEKHLQDAFLDRAEITRLFLLRREAIQFQHVLARMSDVCGKLTNLDVPCIDASVRPYFRDVRDHLMRLDGMVSALVDVTLTVFETSSLLEQQRQGVITRQLAAWAAILGVPAAIAGIYGMTFANLPELHSSVAYLVVVAMMSLCVTLYIRFRKLRWL
jgi:magnesium transporter